MSENKLILVADDNEVSRQLLVSAMEGHDFKVVQAVDGATAFNALKNNDIALAIIDHVMSPHDGLEFISLARSAKYNIPIILITDDQSSDILIEAAKYAVSRVLQKPINPEKLIKDISRILSDGREIKDLGITEIRNNKFSPEELMNKAIDLAKRNVDNKHGGPFGAIVADSEGHIIGDGVNAITSRCDPMAHAEVMAIRKAADFLGKTELHDCSLYCTSEPTAIGQALIISVGIGTVYYGATHEDINNIRSTKDTEIHQEISKPKHERKVKYIQIGREESIEIATDWQSHRI